MMYGIMQKHLPEDQQHRLYCFLLVGRSLFQTCETVDQQSENNCPGVLSGVIER